MRKLLTILFLLASEMIFAQLSTPNGTISSTTNASTGNIGIGTNTPNKKLSVNGSQNISGDLEFGDNGVGISTISGSASSGAIQIKTNVAVGGSENRYLRLGWKDNNAIFSPALSINDDFNVGIGTTTPSERLSVVGNQSISGNLSLGGYAVGISTISGSASSGAIQIKTNSALGGSDNRYLRLGWKDNNAVFSPALSINDDFNVGIGTTSPTERLSVVGNQSVSGNFELGSDGAVSTLSGPANSGAIQIRTNSTLGGYTNRYLRLGWKDNNALFSPALSINDDLNVGIGTITPDAKLAVKGSIHTQEVKVDLQGSVMPDYVFEKDYNLISLPELETYLNQYKHLPEVPSAKEVEAEGMKLKEMNLLLLKKVEELTLYVIEQQKEMKDLKTQVTLLKSKAK